MATLTPGHPATQACGDRRFTLLLADAYGPAAYHRFLAASAREPEPVYGVSNADVTRMHGTATLLIGGGFAFRHITTPGEQLLNLYHSDPDLQLRVGVVPARSGGMLGVSGSF